MPRYGKKKKFISYHFTKFIADRVTTLTPDQYDRLDNEDRELLKNISSASLEEKLWILGKMGERFALVFFDRKKVTEEKSFKGRIYQLLLILRKKLTLSIGQTLSHYGMFVLGDEQIMKALSAVSSLLNHKTYYIIRDYEKFAENMERSEDITIEAEVSKQSKKTVDKFMLGIILGTETISHIQRKSRLNNISSPQFCILLYISINDDRMITGKEIAEYFSGDQQSINKRLKNLIQLGYLEEYTLEETPCYVLTGLGELTINRNRNYLISKTR